MPGTFASYITSASTWHRWVPMRELEDPAGGVDFVPQALSLGGSRMPYKALVVRAIPVYDTSTITSAAAPSERLP